MKSKQRIIVGTEIAGWISPGRRLIKHATESDTIYVPRMSTEADNGSTVLVHDDQDPVRIQSE